MADQKKWFKVWNSILTDPGFEALPNDILGVWTRLGCLISIQGDSGSVTAERAYFERHLRCDFETVRVLPNIIIEEGEIDNGVITVTLKNWFKYQVDSTVYERVKKFRNKQNDNGVRGEKNKKREEEKRKEEKKNKVFVPPTLAEVSVYCGERQNFVDPEKWFAHYQSNGWRVGPNKMKDWKQAVITWEKNENTFPGNGGKSRLNKNFEVLRRYAENRQKEIDQEDPPDET